MPKIKVKKLENFDPELKLPAYETKDAAGADIRASMKNRGGELVIPPGKGPWSRPASPLK